MTTELQIENIAKETIEILKYFDPNFISKIPDNFFNELKEISKISTISVKIDKNKKLKEQNISKESKDLLALIYYSYIANQEEKIEIEKIWNENEEIYQKKLKEQYNTENLFKAKNKDVNENMQIIEYKKESNIKNILNQIINFIRELIRKEKK